MDNQQLNKFNLPTKIIEDIKNKKITSRKQIYRILGIGKKHKKAIAIRKELNNLGLLVYKKYTRESIKAYIQKYLNENNKLPTANDVPDKLVKVSQKLYGTWNRFLLEEFDDQNQRRYADEFSNQELLDTIRNYFDKYQKIPNREEFDGKSKNMPYWEAFVNRFGYRKWSEIIGLALVNNPNIKIYHNHKNGYGKIIKYNKDIYLSNQEYLIGKYLTEKNIAFEKEIEYGNCNFVFDFYLPEYDVYIEYYGIATKEYKGRIARKQAMYNGRTVIEIYKHDNTIGKLDAEVQRLQSLPVMRDGIVRQ